jgi:hypothetical protein
MRIASLLTFGAIMAASPAFADCPDQRMVLKPESGKLGYRVEIVPGESGSSGHALVYRPFVAKPDTYDLIVDPRSSSGSRYILSGPAGALKLEMDSNGTAVLDANREIPSRWRLSCGN